VPQDSIRGDRVFAIEASAHDLSDGFAQWCAEAQPEGIGFAGRLPNRGVTRNRALVGSEEHVLQKIAPFSSNKSSVALMDCGGRLLTIALGAQALL